MSPLELVDDRFEKLARRLREARPAAPEALRQQVLSLAPPPPRRLELRLRSLVPAVAVAALAAAFGLAAVVGIVHGSSRPRATSSAAVHGALDKRSKTEVFKADSQQLKSAGVPFSSAIPTPYRAFSPAQDRLQQYDAFLQVRVSSQDELSRRTQTALQFTRKLGGYVVAARYAAPGKTGTSSLALRIPVDHVQAAIARFSGYGTLLSQRIVLKDLQRRVDALGTRIRRLRARIASGEPQAQLERDKALLRRLTGRRSDTVHRAQLASVALTMVVGAKPKHAATPPSRFHRTLDDAGSVLLRELEILLYALLVAGPLLLLGGAGILAGRSLRRRSDRKLLERA